MAWRNVGDYSQPDIPGEADLKQARGIIKDLITKDRQLLNEKGVLVRGIMPITPMILAWIEMAAYASAEHGIVTTDAFIRPGQGRSATQDIRARKENMARMQAFVADREISVRQAWPSFGKQFIAQWMTYVYGAQHAGTTCKVMQVAGQLLRLRCSLREC
jgi:hypothetical protein